MKIRIYGGPIEPKAKMYKVEGGYYFDDTYVELNPGGEPNGYIRAILELMGDDAKFITKPYDEVNPGDEEGINFHEHGTWDDSNVIGIWLFDYYYIGKLFDADPEAGYEYFADWIISRDMYNLLKGYLIANGQESR